MNPIAAGRLYAIAAATFFGVVTTGARLAYDGGSNPQSVVWLRFVMAAGGIGLACLALGAQWRVPRAQWPGLALVAGCWLCVSFGHLGAVYYMPVSLTAIIFYTFPLLILLIDLLRTGRRLWWPPFAAAFAGLALVLGPDLAALDARGLTLALLGAFAAAIAIVYSEPLVHGAGSFAVGLWVQALCVLSGAVLLLALGGFAVPAGTSGLAGLAGAGVATVLAVLCHLAAIRRAGPARTGLLLNLEPLVIIAAAALLLGERLSAVQILGVALVLGALLAATLRDRLAPGVSTAG